MHEMSICDGILKSAVEAAEAEGATRINRVEVTIGELTQIVEDALQFAFEVLRTDTIATDATLDVTVLEARSRCMDCSAEFRHDRYEVKCPECSSYLCSLLQGRELRIDSIDVD
ncbi:MAG: hydrogenase maturation nickel metallochaperone HypA [Coriobacteriia bacterium]|nr:hydrogenase maturation nickel metallochaperone HypA [Coriobacteriia bacterium]